MTIYWGDVLFEPPVVDIKDISLNDITLSLKWMIRVSDEHGIPSFVRILGLHFDPHICKRK